MFFLILLSSICFISPTEASSLIVFGYYTKYDETDQESYNSLKSFHGYLSGVGMDAYMVDKKGDFVSYTSMAKDIKLAKSYKKRVYVLFSNMNFDENIAHNVLALTSSRTKYVNQFISIAKKDGYQGINLDFEGVKISDRNSYTLFVKELSQKAHQNHLKLIVSVPAKDTDCYNCDWVGPYDYAKIGKYTDYFQLMTYDEHGPWSSSGPIASYSWVENSLKYTVKKVPSNKILMGIAAYAYNWNLSNPKKNTEAYGKKYFDSKKYHWNKKSLSPYITYTDKNKEKHIIWYENKKSIVNKINLVKKYHIGGVAIWRLGQENKNFWSSIE
jgi:spore germination protein YaaH